MKSVLLSLLFVFTLFDFAISCDQTDPICVGSKVYESGVTFRMEGMKKYYCEENSVVYKISKLVAASMEKEMKKRGIDYFSQAYHDFTKVKYSIEEVSEDNVIVHVSGSITAGYKGTEFETVVEVDESFYLKKKQGTDDYCFADDGKINDPSK